MRRCIGLDVHREFCEVAIWEDGVVRSVGQVEATPEALRLFAGSLAASGRGRARGDLQHARDREAVGAPRRPRGGL